MLLTKKTIHIKHHVTFAFTLCETDHSHVNESTYSPVVIAKKTDFHMCQIRFNDSCVSQQKDLVFK